jgi:tetratricopeptide (TPR) repeat protein|tara:strand:- start:729 stop:2075 length:1347 start_codon:yes stop_codon:yes gene_type:complete
MLKTNNVYFFDLTEFEEIIIHYIDIGKHSLAKKAVKLGLEQHPDSIDLKLLEIELCVFENKLDLAKKLLRQVEILEPNNDEVFIQKATIISKEGKHKEAIENLIKALTLTDDKEDIWSLLGMEYLYLDDFENARLNFINCVNEDIEDYSSLYNVVYCFDMEEKHQEAIDFLNKYIDKNPYCEVAWHQIGRQYSVLKRHEQALKAYDFAVIIDELFVGGYLEKAKTLEVLGAYQEAIDNYLITLELDDATAFAFVRIGECYQRLGNASAAILYYKKAVHEDPLLAKGWLYLTNIYFEQKSYEKAAYYISKVLSIDESDTLYWRRYSEIKLKLNFFEEAIKGFEMCLSLGDEDVNVFIALVDVLTFVGEFSAALKTLIKAQKTHKNFAEIEYRFAGLFLALNKQKIGIEHLVKAINIDYDYHIILKELYPSVYFNEGIQKLLKDFKKATE